MNKMYLASGQLCSGAPIRSSREYFEMYQRVAATLPHGTIEQAARELLRAYEDGKGVFIFGNGGSAALASHFACDLGKGTVIGSNGHKRFRVMALTDNVPLMTAWANDSCYEQIFAEQMHNFVTAGDLGRRQRRLKAVYGSYVKLGVATMVRNIDQAGTVG